MAKDMSRVYFVKTTADLLRLRSEKYNALVLSESGGGYLNSQEQRVLREQIKRICAVLASRDCQIGLFD
jgi:L-asparaginase/Glu-tRNA(Gln) amidotransferase subunit D